MNDQPTNPWGNDSTHPLPLGPRPDGPPQAQTYAAAPVPQHTHPRRAGLAAAVVATALVVGAGAGVGGAAAWSTLEDDGSAASASPARTSQVVDTPDSPGADGSVE